MGAVHSTSSTIASKPADNFTDHDVELSRTNSSALSPPASIVAAQPAAVAENTS
jgi:hypothetical protein